jgi:hypothetical protein
MTGDSTRILKPTSGLRTVFFRPRPRRPGSKWPASDFSVLDLDRLARSGSQSQGPPVHGVDVDADGGWCHSSLFFRLGFGGLVKVLLLPLPPVTGDLSAPSHVRNCAARIG